MISAVVGGRFTSAYYSKLEVTIMSSPFTHNVLGEYRSEERWLKILPRKEALRLLVYEGVAFAIGVKLGLSNGFFMFLAVAIGLFGLVMTFLAVKEKSLLDYQKGGGSSYALIIKRKRKHKKEKCVYALAAGVKSTSVKGDD